MTSAGQVSATPQFLKSLNTQFGAVPSAPPPAAAPMPPVPEAQQAPWGVAPQQARLNASYPQRPLFAKTLL